MKIWNLLGFCPKLRVSKASSSAREDNPGIDWWLWTVSLCSARCVPEAHTPQWIVHLPPFVQGFLPQMHLVHLKCSSFSPLFLPIFPPFLLSGTQLRCSLSLPQTLSTDPTGWGVRTCWLTCLCYSTATTLKVGIVFYSCLHLEH